MTYFSYPDAPAATDYATVYIAWELSKADWKLGVLLPGARQIDAAAHVLEPVGTRAAFNLRQTLEKNPLRSPHRQIMLTRQSGEFDAALRGARAVAA
jgi:hypothetical protein